VPNNIFKFKYNISILQTAHQTHPILQMYF